MAIWIQSLSWTLIYALGQGFIVFAALWLVLKLIPTTQANAKYHLSLSAMTILLVWFAATWWQQYHSLQLLCQQFPALSNAEGVRIQQQMYAITTVDSYSSYRPLLYSLKMVLPWLSTFYITGLMLMLVRLSAGMWQIFSLRSTGLSQPDIALGELLASLKNKINFHGSVQLFISTKAPVPMVIGFLKPIILMPAAAIAQLSVEQLESVLLHELAHIKRYDYLVNILQTIVETILFFNPFVWLISAIIRREREHCCDDLVLDHTRKPLPYATALAALATPVAVSSFTVAATGQPNHLFNRIQRIMEMKKNPFSYSRMVAAILIVSAISASIVWFTPSFASPRKEKASTAIAAPEKPTSKVVMDPDSQEKATLVKQLTEDHLVDEVKGFVIEKKQDQLFIDGQLQTPAVAAKYISGIKQEVIHIQISSFTERLRQHPKASLLQIMEPMTFSSGCVDYGPSKGKPGC